MGFSISEEATWPSDNHKYYNNQYNNNYYDYNYHNDNYHDNKVSIRCGRVVTDFLPYPQFRKSLLWCFQYNQFAGPQKQEVINGHSLTIVWQKIEVSDVFQSGNQGNFLVQIFL